MAEGKVEQDPTMEEILQSIKRIIAEDGDEAAPSQTPPTAVEAPKPKPPVVAAPVASASPVADDVLELTDAVQDDGSVVNVKDGNVRDILEDIDELTKAIEAAEQKGPAPAAMSLEEMLGESDVAAPSFSDVLEVVEEDEEEAFEAHDTSSKGEEAMPAFESTQPEARVSPVAQMEPLIEEHVAQATSDAFQQFINALPKVGTVSAPIHSDMATRAGTTVEELLVEAMKPLLKQWLDTYLPETVERIVQDEIRKLIPH